MEMANLTLNMATGGILAQGKGLMTQVRRGGRQAGFAMPGLRRDASAPPAADDPNQLSYLRVLFNRSMTGNVNEREIVFGDEVETIYGPVPTWESVLDPENLGPRGAEMTCD